MVNGIISGGKHGTSLGVTGDSVPQHWLAPAQGLNRPIFPQAFLAQPLCLVNYAE